MKQFTTIKIGYTAGIYGCSNEYFTCILFGGKENKQSFSFYGMYGAEERIAREMESKGYKQFYTPSFYGKMTRKDVTKYIESEHNAINFIKNGFKYPES